MDLADLLQTVYFLLVGDAAVWAEETANVVKLLEDPVPTADTVEQFSALFAQRFPSNVQEAPAVHFDTEIADLCQ